MASFMDAKDLNVETAVTNTEAVPLPETSDLENDSRKYSRLIGYIEEEFGRSKRKRQSDEARWLECFRNYKGIYGDTTQFTSTEKSRAFIKITKTKVQAAYAQIVDVLFAGNKFPIGVESARVPIGALDAINIETKPNPSAPKSNPQMDPHIAALFGPKEKLLEPVKDQIEPGVGITPSSITFEPAKDAAKKMEKVILDQLEEASATKSLRSTIFEMSLFGSGAYKGPFAMDKEYPRWSKDGTYNPITKTIPHMEYVSIWDCYPDADARNMSEAEKFIQRHRLSKTELRALKKRPYFRNKSIEKVIQDGPNYSQEPWEQTLIDSSDNTTHERWEVLEYWGIMDTEIAKEAKIGIPRQFAKQDQIQVNAWICSGQVLRLVFNPFTPARIPYKIVPYEINPYSIFGTGVAENMLDTQLLMNGFMRLAVDNATLSSNVIFEVNEDFLVPGQSMEIYPGKVFRRVGGAQGNVVSSQKIDNVTQETLALFDKARQLADESTGMPSYAHGMTGVQGMNRTASGMSMLMGAAAQNIKAVVRNIDDYLLNPLGKDLFAFNMQFNFDQDFIGELSVIAKGTESLMRNEVRSQRLLQLAQFAAPNPSMAPFIRWDYVLREYAASLDLDEDKVVNDPRAAMLQAMQMQKASQAMGVQPQDPNAQGPQGGIPNQVEGGGAPPASDPTGNGNGNIGPGASPPPGAEGYSGPQGAPK
jgi:hypothetical protein